MSQPPQYPSNDSWGQSSGNDSWGQSSNNSSSGYGSSGYGTEQPSSGAGGDFLYGGSANSGDNQPLPGPPAPDQAPQYSQGSLPMGGPPPQQSSGGGGKGKIIAIVGCAGCGVISVILVAIILVGVILGGGGEDDGPTDSGPTSSEEGSTPTSEEGGSGAVSTDPGTLEEPNPAGTAATLELTEIEGTVDVGFEVNWDAEENLKGQDPSLEPAPDGSVYVLVTGTYTYHGPDELDPVFGLAVTYYNGAGVDVEEEIVLTENSIIDVEPAKDGETTKYDQVYLIPEDEANAGTFEVRELFNYDGDPVFIAAA